MHSKILSDVERKLIRAFLKANGEKSMHMRVVATRARLYLPQIKRDLELLEKLLATYEKAKKA